MSLKPWREIAEPHQDVLHGTFKQSEFAADISQVANGIAPPEYQDAEQFFARTFITEGMRLLLISVTQRLAGQGGDPVVQLQTPFGGGKTHSMLAVLHLAGHEGETSRLQGIPPILDEAGITDLPRARVAVIDGIALSPSQELTKRSGQKVTTLWGELAWQLLGEQGYELVRDADVDGTSPGKTVLIELLQRAAPCVILMDELLAFLRQFAPGKQYRAGTLDSNLSFIQALTEALKAVPNAMLLASLPESEVEIGGDQGQRTLVALEKYFGRVESVWKPVATEEAFEIVRRRLFAQAGDPAEVRTIARQYADFYQAHGDAFPPEAQEAGYFERLCKSYPIHPEIFDRLYEDWSTLDKFQRTRGVLQYLAIVIHRLWVDDNRDALIMPGSIPLDDGTVRNKSIHYLPQGWEPIIEGEVDGTRSAAFDIDSHETRIGAVQAARRSMRTIFLGSAPADSQQTARGIGRDRILLGAVQPGQTLGVFEDALKRLRDRLHYLYFDQDRYWLDTRPNLRRELESRKRAVDETHALLPLLRDKVRGALGSQHRFAGIHVFPQSADVPDDYGAGVRLVVLSPAAGYNRADARLAESAAQDLLFNRGDQPRQKRNRLLFLAPDFDVVGRLKEGGKSLLAWREILEDVDEGRLVMDTLQVKYAKREKESAEKVLTQLVRETYKWLMSPSEDFVRGQPELHWEAVALSTGAPSLIAEIEQRLDSEEWIISEWSPIHLKALLERWYFKEGVTEVSALKVYQDCCHYLYLPRLLNDGVFRDAIAKGVASMDYIGFAAGKEGDRYLGFMFGQKGFVDLSEASLLIARDRAEAYWQAYLQPAPAPAGIAQPPEIGGRGIPGVGPGGGTTIPPTTTSPIDTTGTTGLPAGGVTPPAIAPRTQFYGTIGIDPVRAKMDFAQIYDEVVEQFTAKLGVKVEISVEIRANSDEGFDEGLQRTIKENCNVLNFGSSEFESGEN